MELEEFEAIFHRYKNIVFKIAYLTLGDVQEAEDVMQEVFIKVYRARDSFRPEKGQFNSWLHRITINQSISRRRRKSLPSFSLERLREEGLDLPEASPQLPEEFLMKQEESKRIQEAMSFLDRKHRAILALRYFDDLSYNEIAQVLGIPLGTVKSRINTAIKALRRELVEKEVIL
jgi:RNA polymerase sigma-70 factor (ECF subfamily)